MSDVKYFGVYIPTDTEQPEQNDLKKIHVYNTYEETCKVLKDIKHARFKSFRSRKEAEYFSLNGSVSGPGNPSILNEVSNFKSVKRNEIHEFRKFIETGNIIEVQKRIWENPRYLIGSGDTPTIIMEGPRYNALHITAKHDKPQIADLILRTVSDEYFIKLLYGPCSDNTYVVRPEVLVDLYLNTPDKSWNETPLHFAVKFGFIEVVKVFIKYPQLQLNLKNKSGQIAKDIICKFCGNNSRAAEIHKLLDELFFVPVWRSNDDDTQPIIGQPFSPKSPPVYPLSISPLNPSMEIKAVAGPMTLEEATHFQKTWKSPKSSCQNTPHLDKGILLRSPLGSRKEIEKIGRSLAKKFHVSWKEYWPFLDKFIDLASDEGLKMLEEYLYDKIAEKTRSANDILSPISDLCRTFSNIQIKSPSDDNLRMYAETSKNDNVLPYTYMEVICMTCANDVVEIFLENYAQNNPAENIIASLLKVIRGLIISINTCKEESILKNFPFNLIHARVAVWIKRNLSKIRDHRLNYAVCTFRMIYATDESEIIQCVVLSPSSRVELENIVRNLKCVSNIVIKLLESTLVYLNPVENEEQCKEEWSAMKEQCLCFSDFLFKQYRKIKLSSTAKKKIIFSDDDDSYETDEKQKVTSETDNCDNLSNMNCDTKLNDEDEDELFYTPPSSISVSDNEISDDEMRTPDEGPDIFIYNNKGTTMDNAVLDAIADIQINPITYPCIYRWKHSILLHSTFKRANWPSPSIKNTSVPS